MAVEGAGWYAEFSFKNLILDWSLTNGELCWTRIFQCKLICPTERIISIVFWNIIISRIFRGKLSVFQPLFVLSHLLFPSSSVASFAILIFSNLAASSSNYKVSSSGISSGLASNSLNSIFSTNRQLSVTTMHFRRKLGSITFRSSMWRAKSFTSYQPDLIWDYPEMPSRSKLLQVLHKDTKTLPFFARLSGAIESFEQVFQKLELPNLGHKDGYLMTAHQFQVDFHV